jgi:acetyl/propionyl-CoA carboxylase alpha subunit
LQELNVGGVRTGVPAALAVLEDTRFVKGDFDTHLLSTIDLTARVDEARAAALAAALHRWHGARRTALESGETDRTPWLRRGREAHADYPAQIPGPRAGGGGR